MSELELLKQKIINVENDQKALRNKLDVWRNEANNMITNLKNEMKKEYSKLNNDFLSLGNLIKDIFTPPQMGKLMSIEEAIKATEKFAEETNKEIEAFKKMCEEATELVGIKVTNPEYLENFTTYTPEKCDSCKNNISPPINDCAKHKESGAKIGELVKCFSLTGLSTHKDYYEPIRKD